MLVQARQRQRCADDDHRHRRSGQAKGKHLVRGPRAAPKQPERPLGASCDVGAEINDDCSERADMRRDIHGQPLVRHAGQAGQKREVARG